MDGWATRCHQLRKPSLTRLEALTISHNLITDAGVRHLLPLAHLAELDLRHTDISDVSLGDLRRFPHRTALGLADTQVDLTLLANTKFAEPMMDWLDNCNPSHGRGQCTVLR